MRNKKQWKVTMVNLEQIATKKYPFCSTSKAVQNFCTKYGVNRFWWTPPQGSKKLLMVDFHDFHQCWNHIYGKPAQSRQTSQQKCTTAKSWAASKTQKPKTKRTTKTPRTYKYGQFGTKRSSYRRAA